MSEASKTSVNETYERTVRMVAKAREELLAATIEENVRLTAELEIARKALEPFAEIAKEFTGQLSDDLKNTMHWAVPTVGEFRAALRALQGQQK